MEIEIVENLKKAVLECDAGSAEHWALEAMKCRIDPLTALDTLTEAIREVGDGFGKGDLFLPDLIGAADSLESAMPVVVREIEGKGIQRKSLGTVIIGSVYGDIHTIGKSMVGSLLTAEGFVVHDLGINVQARRFLEAVRENKADMLAMSSLLTTTAQECGKVSTPD